MTHFPPLNLTQSLCWPSSTHSLHIYLSSYRYFNLASPFSMGIMDLFFFFPNSVPMASIKSNPQGRLLIQALHIDWMDDWLRRHTWFDDHWRRQIGLWKAIDRKRFWSQFIADCPLPCPRPLCKSPLPGNRLDIHPIYPHHGKWEREERDEAMERLFRTWRLYAEHKNDHATKSTCKSSSSKSTTTIHHSCAILPSTNVKRRGFQLWSLASAHRPCHSPSPFSPTLFTPTTQPL